MIQENINQEGIWDENRNRIRIINYYVRNNEIVVIPDADKCFIKRLIKKIENLRKQEMI